MKRFFFFLMTAVLLSGVNASAQKNYRYTGQIKPNSVVTEKKITATSLKGDVNTDGVVDVADIASVIDVMANGLGSLQQTADVNSDGMVDVADIASIIDIMANGGSTEEESGWYIGTASEEQIQDQSYINGLKYIMTGKPTSTITLSKGYNVLLYPSSWGTIFLEYGMLTPYTASDLGISNPPGKMVLVYESQSQYTTNVEWAVYYIGVATESQIHNQSYIDGLYYNKMTKPTLTLGFSEGNNVFVFPSSWGEPTIAEDPDFGKILTPQKSSDLKIFNPLDKTVLVYKSNSTAVVYIRWPREDSDFSYYYAVASEEQIQNQNYIDGLRYNRTGKPTSSICLAKGYNLFVLPESWGIPTVGEDPTYSKKYTPYTASDLGITNPSGKIVLVYGSNAGGTVYIKW